MTTAHDRLLQSDEGRRELCVEQTITNVTELICERLDESDMSRSDLAAAMGITPGRVTQLLNGNANLTLRSIANALAAFGHIMDVSSKPIVVDSNVSEWTPRFACDAQSFNNYNTPQTERAAAGIFERFSPRSRMRTTQSVRNDFR